MTRVLLLQGANMSFLGRREPHWYGTTTAAELDAMVLARAAARGCTLDVFYTHVEGEAIARLYQALDEGCRGVLMNPAGFLYAGYALRDCLVAIKLPLVEVHMTNLEKRGRRSVTIDVADGAIMGLGIQSYLLGLDALLDLIGHAC